MKISRTGAVENLLALEDDLGQRRGFAIYTRHGDETLRHEVVSLTEGVALDRIDFKFDDARVGVTPLSGHADGPTAGHVENGWAIGAGGGMMGFSIDIRWTPNGSDPTLIRSTITTPVSEHSYTHSLRADWEGARDAAVNFVDFASTAHSWWEGSSSPFVYTLAFANYMRRPVNKCPSGGSTGTGGGSSGGCQ